MRSQGMQNRLFLWSTLLASWTAASVIPAGSSSTESDCSELNQNGSDCVEKFLPLFLRHVMKSVGWSSVVVIVQSSAVPGLDLTQLLLADEEDMSLVVLHWPVTTNRSSTSRAELYRAITAEGNNRNVNLVIVGLPEFTQQMITEIVNIKNSAAVMFDWLTTIQRENVTSFLKVAEQVKNLAIVVQEKFCHLTVETLLREGNTTRLSQVAQWSPCNSPLPLLTKDSVFPNIKCGLCGRTLSMVTMRWSPFIIHHQNETSTWYTGFCMDLLHILTEQLNFTYVITEPGDKNWGQQLPNGTWVGMTGMLHRKEVDFALTGMSVTAGRATVSDYTRGFYFDEIIMLTSYPDPTPVGWSFYIRPFQWLVFALLGCGLVVMTGFLVVMDRHYAMGYGNPLGSTDRRNAPLIMSSVANAAETLFGALIGRAVAYDGASGSGRVLMCAWLLFSMVTVATYTGKLTSNSVVIQEPVPFRSLSELVQRTDYRWGFSHFTMLEAIFANSSSPDYQKFYQKMMEFEKEDPTVRSTGVYDDTARKVLAENYVRLTSESSYKTLKTSHCQLTTAQERLFQDTLVIYLQKDSPYTAMFDHELAKMTELGILEYLTNKWFPDPSSCYGEEAQVMSVSLELVPMAFLMAAAGLVLATLVLVLEHLVRDSRCQPHPDRLAPLCLPSCCM